MNGCRRLPAGSSNLHEAHHGGIPDRRRRLLLIAQMKNQDPTKPTDPAQFVAQLASFSNVEQGIKMNNKLDTLMTSMALSQAEGIIGRTVASEDGSVVGTVAGIRIISGGAVALLQDGRELLLGAGVTVA
jgi:flagellar basal-body rod modification protein FlgD